VPSSAEALIVLSVSCTVPLGFVVILIAPPHMGVIMGVIMEIAWAVHLGLLQLAHRGTFCFLHG
jgi:hypothetical protein